MSERLSLASTVRCQIHQPRTLTWKVLKCRESASMATGHFSWRVLPTGTIPASGHPSLASPALAPAARGPWAHTSKARARLAGLSFGAGQPTPAMQVSSTCCALHTMCMCACGDQTCCGNGMGGDGQDREVVGGDCLVKFRC